MSRRLPMGLLTCLVLCAGVCGSCSGDDGGPGDSGHAGDADVCGPGSAPPGTCVMDSCATGRLTCVGAPCPYDCCVEGRIRTCFIPAGSECGVVVAVDCGDGTCSDRYGCPDAGPSDAGPVVDAATGTMDAGPGSDAGMPTCDPSAIAFPMGGGLTPGTLCDDVFVCVIDAAHAALVEAAATHFVCSMTPEGPCTGWTCAYRNPGGPSVLDEAEIAEICRVTVVEPAPSLTCRVYL